MISPTHIFILVIILLIAVVIFGAGRLGDMGGALGKSVREFRQEVKSDDKSVKTEDDNSPTE
jgi:sec-independent protein translocase protein TatA